MRITPKMIYTRNGEAESRFNTVIKQYDTYINKILHDNRTYKMIAMISIIMILCSVIGWFFALSLRKEELVIVEVNEMGRSRYFILRDMFPIFFPRIVIGGISTITIIASL